MFPLIILFGPQQAGKSTASQALVEKGYTRVSFADVIYDMMSVLLGEDARGVSKTEPLEALQGRTLRQALQTLGTEWGRGMLGENIWVDAATARIRRILSAGGRVVMDDCRFTNEYDALRIMGAHFVRIDRPDLPDDGDAHASEKDRLSFVADACVTNDYGAGIEWLHRSAEVIRQALRLELL